MTTLDIPGLEERLASFELTVPLSEIEAADAVTKPLDLWRIPLATILADLVECSTEAAFKAIQWPNNIYNGDLAVILPKLCQSKKAADVAIDLLKQVCTLLFRP
jgi:arginyl-tRNA synthetase